MHLWFIKLGKALSALKREGLVRGGRRVLASFFAIFRRVGNGEVLIITGGLGDSARYRAWHIAEELTLHHIPAQAVVQDNPFLTRYVNRFSVFIFHRTMVTGAIRAMIVKIKEQKKTIIFDTDDLVYDAQYFQYMDSFKNMNAFEKLQYAGGVGAEILADPYTAVCTTTTTYLAEKLRERGKRVFLVPNRLCKEDVFWATENGKRKTEMGERGRENREQKNEKDYPLSVIRYPSVVIGYFSGTKSHDKDFAVAVPALVRILEECPNVQLFLVGPLESGSALERFADRIESLPYVPRKEHFANVARVDINIAPLEVGNPFCEAKSELKFFEAGIVGVPTVASGTQTYKEAMTDGLDGFVATSEEEWYDRISRLITDADLRRRMGDLAHRTAHTRYTTETAENNEYYTFLKSKIHT